MATGDDRDRGQPDLAGLLDINLPRQEHWQADDLRAIFAQQLQSPIEVELEGLNSGAVRRLKTISAARGLVLKSLGDLLLHPRPPLELLILVKRFAKAHLHRAEASLPADIAKLLYLAAIVAARLAWDERITEQDDAQLLGGMRWACGRPWIDARFHGLFERGLEVLEGDPGAQ